MFHNKDVFVWSRNNLWRVDRSIIVQNLNVDLKSKPRKKKLHNVFKKRTNGDSVEVKWLLNVRVIREN